MRKKTSVFKFTCLALLAAGILSAQEPLKYEVSVEAVLVPLFAVDASGSPVYDLEQEELALYVNGRPVEITYFKRYEFEYDKEITQKTTVREEKRTIIEPPDRVIFIIIDSVFNTSNGLRRSKKIASNLIKKSGEGDRFIIIENTPGGGLKHLAGPGGSRENLIKQVEKIVPQRSIWSKNLFSTDPGRGSRQGSPRGLEVMEYKATVRRFSKVLSRLKYALKTITQPKIVFLISEGISKGAFKEGSNIKRGPESSFYTRAFMKTHFFNYLKEIVKAVNHGGSVVYTINPQHIERSLDEGVSGEMSLRYLADESGGKYFAGSDVEKIIKRIKKTTAAYYELAFHIPAQLGDNLELTIKCKRKDVKVHTLSHSERNRPYHQMEPVQKKIFALNVVSGGSWSRLLGRVMEAKFKIIKKEKNQYCLNVELPGEMKNRNLDVCLLYLEPTTEAVDMDFETIKANESLELKFLRKKNKRQFFVIIDPTIPYCIYNRIK
jgi:VWFA-related protein